MSDDELAYLVRALAATQFGEDEGIVRAHAQAILARWDEASRIKSAKAERAAEIAANMRQEGLPVSVIAKVTGLSLAEIEALPVK